MLEEEKVSHDTTNKIAKLVLKEFENILPFMSLISCAKYLHPNPRSLKMHKLSLWALNHLSHLLNTNHCIFITVINLVIMINIVVIAMIINIITIITPCGVEELYIGGLCDQKSKLGPIFFQNIRFIYKQDQYRHHHIIICLLKLCPTLQLSGSTNLPSSATNTCCSLQKMDFKLSQIRFEHRTNTISITIQIQKKIETNLASTHT